MKCITPVLPSIKVLRLSREICMGAQTKLENMEPKGEERVCESHDQIGGEWYF